MTNDSILQIVSKAITKETNTYDTNAWGFHNQTAFRIAVECTKQASFHEHDYFQQEFKKHISQLQDVESPAAFIASETLKEVYRNILSNDFIF